MDTKANNVPQLRDLRAKPIYSVGKIRVFAYIPQAQRLMIASWQKQVNFVRPIIFLFLQRFLAKKKSTSGLLCSFQNV